MQSLEKWVPLTIAPEVVGWYEISNFGRVRYAVGAPAKVLRGNKAGDEKILNRTGGGYLYLQVWYGGKAHGFRVHRLVALHFVPNPKGYKEVNHIDGDKDNNRADNLEWCSRSENVKHSFDKGLKKPHRWSLEERQRIAKKVSEYQQQKARP